MKIRFLFFLALLLLSTLGQAQTAPPPPRYVAGELIFKVQERYNGLCSANKIGLPELEQALKAAGVVSFAKIYPNHQPPATETNRQGDRLVDLTTIFEAKLAANADPLKAAAALKNNPFLKYAEPRWIYESFNPPPPERFVPNEPNFNTAAFWWANAVKAPEAWFINKGNPNVTIGIVDTGFDLTHPELVNKRQIRDPLNGVDDDGDGYIDNNGIDLVGADVNNPTIDTNPAHLALSGGSDHGAMVAGCACAETNNAAGTTSPGYNTKFLPIKASADNSSSLIRANEGVVYAADRGCDIINLSLGSFFPSPYSQDVTDYATFNKNALVVAAAGNGNFSFPAFPAANENVLCVAGLRVGNLKSSVSSFYYAVDLAAPATMSCAKYKNTTGSFAVGYTSHASPMAASMASLVKSVFPNYTALQVGERVRVTCDNIYNLAGNAAFSDKLGKGIPNMYRMLTEVTPAVRLKRPTLIVTDANGNNSLEPGETGTFVGTFRNFLDPSTAGLTVTLSSPDPNVTIQQGTATLGALATLGQTTNAASPFQFTIGANTPNDYQLFFKLTYSDGTYQDFEYFYVWANPTYQDIRINKLHTTITAEGSYGYRNYPDNWQGVGVYYNKKNEMLYEGGLLVATSATNVADQLRNESGGGARDTDFSIVERATLAYPGPVTDLQGQSKYSAAVLPSPIEVKQVALADSGAGRDKYVIFEYQIKNTGATAMNEVYVGLFSDFDIVNYGQNRANFDPTRRLAYIHSATDNVYAGMAALTGGNLHVRSIENDGSFTFTNAEKFAALSGGVSNAVAGQNGLGTDICQFISVGPLTMAAGETRTVAFAVLAGESVADLQASVDAAYNRYYESRPRVRFLAATPNISVPEGNTGNQQYTLTFGVENAVRFPVTLNLVSLGGTAAYPSDIQTSPGLSAGSVAYTFSSNGVRNLQVKVYGDVTQEPDETFAITLNNLNVEEMGRIDATRAITILNDDQTCQNTDGLAATNITSNSVRLNWNATPNVVTYRVRYRLFGLSGVNSWTEVAVPAPATFVDLTNLYPASNYNWFVIADCGVNAATGTAIVSFATTGSPVACAPPTNLQSATNGTAATLTWTADPAAAFYNLQFRAVGAGSWTQYSVLGTSLTINNLTPGQNYEWQVRSRCGTPVSAYTALQTFTQPAGKNEARTTDRSTDNPLPFALYPNPNDGEFQLTLTAAQPQTALLSVYDPAGRLVYQNQPELQAGQNLLNVRLGELPQGLYLLQIYANGATRSARVAIK